MNKIKKIFKENFGSGEVHFFNKYNGEFLAGTTREEFCSDFPDFEDIVALIVKRNFFGKIQKYTVLTGNKAGSKFLFTWENDKVESKQILMDLLYKMDLETRRKLRFYFV